MSRLALSIATVVAMASPAAFADHLPGTMNFENVTGGAGKGRIIQTVGETSSNEKEVEFGDFDNDNDLDVVVAVAFSDFGQRRNKLYRNDNGVFTEISGAPVIPGFSGTDVARNAFFRDYNLDGWLDIIIVNDNNTSGDPGRTKIYINQHPGGVFSHYTEEGLERLGSGTGGAACGGVSFDADNDGDADLYVGNYPGPSQDTLYFNRDNQPGFFTEMTALNVPNDSAYTVDVASADMNGDGNIDLLISNHSGNNNFLYYNDNQGAGSDVGDFSYAGSVQNLGPAGVNENSIEPGDFDNDGLMDFYWSNRSGNADRILRNTGNDANNKAVFVLTGNLPPSVTSQVSRKATVADLNADGRADVFVSASNYRPTILRNTTVNGSISFIDWTPAQAFPSGVVHKAWHGAVFDSNGDGDMDIFLGAWTNDHLFEQVPSTELVEADLPGGAEKTLPAFFNHSPIAIEGSVMLEEQDVYVAPGLGNGFISVVINGNDDYLLEVLNSNDAVLTSSDRGGLGTEEALQLNINAGDFKLRVTNLEAGKGGSIYDLDSDGQVGTSDLLTLLAAWGKNPGHPADFDGDGSVGTTDLLALLSNWGPAPSAGYILEVLSRS